jgi:Ran GTPase-activating protein (RanGAP) involved in mRNA processing and transport
VAGTKLLAQALKENQIITNLNISSNNMTYDHGDMSGVVALADAIPDMGALSVLSLKNNDLGTKDAGEVIGEMLKMNSVLKLDLSGNYVSKSAGGDAAGFVQGISKGIVGNGALTTLILKDNKLLTPTAGKVLSRMLAANTMLKELDVSSNNWEEHGRMKGDGPGFAKKLAVGISGNGALSSANLLGNSIPVEQAQELVKIMRSKENLTTFCGLSREETELNFSGQDLGAGDAVLIANDISDMGALTALNLADNKIGATVGWMIQPSFVTPDQRYKHSDGRIQGLLPEGEQLGKPEGVIAVANAIKDMGALARLNLASNSLGAKEAKIIAAVLPKCT